jgi:hypothetical protein
MSDDDSAAEKVADKASERITLARGELWLLRIAAATGVFSMLAHGLEFLHEIGLM